MKVKLIAIVALVAAGVLVAFSSISSAASKTNEYNSYLDAARANAKNKVPYMACQNYRQAFSVRCDDEDVYKEYLEQSKLLGESFYESAVNDYVTNFPQSPTAYEELCNYQYDTESYKAVIQTALTAKELGVATEEVRKKYLECYYMFRYICTDLEDASTFLGDYALVKKEGLYGYLSSYGSYLLYPIYKDANAFLGTSTAVNDGKEWYMINEGGYKIARTDEKFDKMSFISNGKIRVMKNGKYGYVDSSFKGKHAPEYEYASNFKNSVAAVKKNGKWALIDSEEKAITEFMFEDILLDEYDTCINNGLIFAKKDGKYYIVNEKGEKVSENGFEKAYPFMGDEPAAVCVKGKWGFVDTTGKMVIEPEYDNAKSFSNGLAPVCKGESWGYINSDKEYRIKSQFSDCLPFSDNGIAAVKEAEVWNYIKLLAYYE